MSVIYDYKRVRESEWDTTNLSGGAIIALICPVCASHVPHGNDYSGTSYRERHIRWHEGRP